jgi:thiol-disulfide isomerase/thioredoxin
MRRILFFVALVIIFAGCSKKAKFNITGVINNPGGKYIYLSLLEVDTPILIDSAKINGKGSFRFKVNTTESEFYQLGVSATNFITLLAEPGEKINLEFSSNDLFKDYRISGSPGSEKLQILDNALADTKSKLDSLSAIYTKASAEPDFDLKRPVLEEEFNKLIKAQRRTNIEFIVNNVSSLASIKALYQRIDPETYVLYDPRDLQYLKIVTDSLTRHYPNSKQVKALARDFEKELKQMNTSRIEEMARSMPQTKLDPDLKTIDGKRIALSSLKGKYVLLTFWSVKSRDCIQENLQFKELYKLYNKKGFEIYQINIDINEEEWKTAVRFDELPWICTREDDPANPKNTILYNVKSVPANYLYDKESKIIASNIHGRALQLKLDQIFN